MGKIKVGEYVRTISGNIDRVDALYGMIENTVHLENHKWQDIKNIAKHSPNIIDLIEVDDYVNGVRILDITGDYIHTAEFDCCKERLKSKLKSIVTKEMYKSVEYEV